MIAGDSYRCEACGETYETGRSDEEVAAEYEAMFDREYHEEDAAVVCDDCWRKMGFGQ